MGTVSVVLSMTSSLPEDFDYTALLDAQENRALIDDEYYDDYDPYDDEFDVD